MCCSAAACGQARCGCQEAKDNAPIQVQMFAVGPHFFETLRIPDIERQRVKRRRFRLT